MSAVERSASVGTCRSVCSYFADRFALLGAPGSPGLCPGQLRVFLSQRLYLFACSVCGGSPGENLEGGLWAFAAPLINTRVPAQRGTEPSTGGEARRYCAINADTGRFAGRSSLCRVLEPWDLLVIRPEGKGNSPPRSFPVVLEVIATGSVRTGENASGCRYFTRKLETENP